MNKLRLAWTKRPGTRPGKFARYRIWRTLCGRYAVLERTLSYGDSRPFYAPYRASEKEAGGEIIVNRRPYQRLGDRWRTYRSLQAAKRVCEQDWRTKHEPSPSN